MRTLGLLLAIALAVPAWGQVRAIDPSHSEVTLHVFRAGLFSFAGDNHEIRAPIAAGTLDVQARKVEFRIDARRLKVLDPQLAPDKRAEVQERMLGPEVLDVARYPEIVFHSTKVRSDGPGHLVITGLLTLRNRTEPVTVSAAFDGGTYRGSGSLKQTAFGIKPITIAGGTVKVKDEIKLDFVVVPGGAK